MKIGFVFLILISFVACNEKKNEIDSDLLLSVALLQPPDRAENYDYKSLPIRYRDFRLIVI
ncbi:hypothetical protein LEP1GSC133_3255 [Leptospira borgpetersenii serovar Pomona str. 200901868]|uniref:Lipoprotein n=1 Tax=Leptospira borgpetersenii serovar Pomona str. 200901868 TaxID=1192866 RepID=M6VX85_LEPBO|nr:hypothetical protein LEP1GSC133_3255 [Leptospira borgpetersenii serovar Pomona str. 200901868]